MSLQQPFPADDTPPVSAQPEESFPNEELQTAKEEIQATNEELSTINDELYRRNAETSRISDDFQNLLSIIHIPILMVEDDLRIRRFTPMAAALFNLISLKHSNDQIRQARDYADAIVQTVREALVVLDHDLRVITANRQFYQTFQVSAADTEGRSIFELGNGQWDIPQLRSLLHDLLPQNLQVNDFEVVHRFETIGLQTMRLNARKMVQVNGDDLVLLAIETVPSDAAAQGE